MAIQGAHSAMLVGPAALVSAWSSLPSGEATDGSAAGGNHGTPARESSRRLPTEQATRNLLAEHRQLLAAALDERGQSEDRLEPFHARAGTSNEGVEVLPLQDVPVLALHFGTQPGRALHLQPQQLGALRRDDQEPRLLLSHRDLVASAQHGVADHRCPLDLEQESQLAADVPDGVDRAERLGRGTNDERQVHAPLIVGEAIHETSAIK